MKRWLAPAVLSVVGLRAAGASCSPFEAGDAPSAVDAGSATDGGGAALDGQSPLDDAGVVAPVACDAGTHADRLVFVSSRTFPGGALGGIDGADTACQAMAAASTDANVCGRHFIAWLSVAGAPASKRLSDVDRPFVRTDGTVIANSLGELLDGDLASAISRDENGAQPTSVLDVWTGTFADGGIAPDRCGEWMTNSYAMMGIASTFNGSWTARARDGCARLYGRIYCFEP